MFFDTFFMPSNPVRNQPKQDKTMGETRRRWTAAEDALLWDLFQLQEKAPTGKCRKINWNEIARQIPGRSNKDCRKRFYNRFTGGLRKGSWAPEEDARLTALVRRYQYRWATIAQKMETRNADQCSKRWHHCLNPDLERSPWTDTENKLLLSAIKTHGSSWKDIQRCHFPTRSANNIKNQYTILSRRCVEAAPAQRCCSPSSPPKCPPTPAPSSSSSSPPPPPPSSSFTDTINCVNNLPYQEEVPYSHITSLSSTPQPSPNGYFAMTPEPPAGSLEIDAPETYFYPYPSRYLQDCWLTPWTEGAWTTSNIDPLICQPAGMDFGAQFSDHNRRFVDIAIDPRVQFMPAPSTNPSIGFLE